MPRTLDRMLSCRCKESEAIALRNIADDRKTSVSCLIRTAVSEYVENFEGLAAIGAEQGLEDLYSPQMRRLDR
ncbi:MAG: ribbon-helix-helix protein, CopG family [Candidatus Altiarchaeota archaeon]|nr:ribbon-helix-helix protein, CopG family [Candidatus Altiarchaeota archaeon]